MAAKARSKTLPPLMVRYPKRMKPGKSYTVQVSWRGKPPRLDDGPNLTVRLIMGGAQVVPSEREMDPNRPNDKAVFFVTPLSIGWLKGERLEVLADGEKVQEIPLPAKVVTQRKTWLFLLLTFLVPWFLITFFQSKSEWYERHDPWAEIVQEYTPVNFVEKKTTKLLTDWGADEKYPDQFWKDLRLFTTVGIRIVARDQWEYAPSSSADVPANKFGNGTGKKNGKGGGGVAVPLQKPDNKGGDPDGKKGNDPAPDENQVIQIDGKNGDTKTGAQKKDDQDKGAGRPGGGGKRGRGKRGGGKRGGGAGAGALQPPEGPEFELRVPPETSLRLFLPFWSALFFFVLTILSLWWHRQRRRRRVGKPLTLAQVD